MIYLTLPLRKMFFTWFLRDALDSFVRLSYLTPLASSLGQAFRNRITRSHAMSSWWVYLEEFLAHTVSVKVDPERAWSDAFLHLWGWPYLQRCLKTSEHSLLFKYLFFACLIFFLEEISALKLWAPQSATSINLLEEGSFSLHCCLCRYFNERLRAAQIY